jgi:hypothetical protein
MRAVTSTGLLKMCVIRDKQSGYQSSTVNRNKTTAGDAFRDVGQRLYDGLLYLQCPKVSRYTPERVIALRPY